MPRTRRQRNSDIKVIAAATVSVLLAGFVIAAGIWVATRGDAGQPVCGQLTFDATDVRQRLEDGGPELRTGGGGCSFWLALDEGDIVAYRADQQELGCTLLYKSEFECNGESVDLTTLAQYATRIIDRQGVDAIVVDLRPEGVASTTSSSTPTTLVPTASSTTS